MNKMPNDDKNEILILFPIYNDKYWNYLFKYYYDEF